MECCRTESHINERIRSHDENQNLGGSSNVMIYEPSPCCLVHSCIDVAVDSPQEEFFENVETDEEVHDKDDGEDETTERCESRYRLQRNLCHMRTISRRHDECTVVFGPVEMLTVHSQIPVPISKEKK